MNGVIPEQDPSVRRTLPDHFRDKDRHTDTAGIPWHGRDYAASPFPHDRGERSARIAQALAQCDEGVDAFRENLAQTLLGERVLIPIQAIATDTAVTESGLHADNASDMAMVKLQLASGEVALPLFTSVEALTSWSPEARPVPMQCEQAAQAAVAEGCTMLVLDVGRDNPIVLNRSALWALGQGRAWMAPHRDPAVREEIAQIPQHIAPIVGVDALPGESRELELVLTLVPGLGREELDAVVSRVQSILAGSQVIAERVSSLKLSLR